MHCRQDKQNQKDSPQSKQRLKKMKKQKNPYNINISFNFNNPKKVVSNQINKTIKINNYSLAQQLVSARSTTYRPNMSKVLNSTSKYQSTSLPKSKQFSKYQCYLQNNNDPATNSHHKRTKKSKSKPYDIETKSKSDFTYNTSILNMPFPGDDPLPQMAVKKLNRMKRYFLEKIGSMDITMTDNHQNESNLSTDLKYPNQKYQQQFSSHLQQKQIKYENNKRQDDMMTQKLSEYQYENLISYENQNVKQDEQHVLNSVLKSKQIFQQQNSEIFPQAIIDSINSMSIKNEYLRHHSKFIDQNIGFFHKSQGNKINKSIDNNKVKNSSFDSFSLYTLKSKLLNQNHSSHAQNKHSKQQSRHSKSSNQVINKKISETKKMKQKIQLIQDILLKNQSSRSLLINPNGKYKNTSQSSQLQNNNNKKYRAQKPYTIKTQIELPNEMINEIKNFQFNQQSNQQTYPKNARDQQVKFMLPDHNKSGRQEVNFEEFLMDRSRQDENKQTKDIIRNYIDLLNENQDFLNNKSSKQKFVNDKSLLHQVSSMDEVHYLSSINTSRLKSSLNQNLSENNISYLNDNQQNQNLSQVSSYICGDSKISRVSAQLDGYSKQRMQKIQIQRKMRQDFIKKIINSKQNNHLKAQDEIIQPQKSKNPSEQFVSESSQKINHDSLTIQPLNLNDKFNNLLGFIQQNLNIQSTDKKILQDLYEKLKSVSNVQNFKKVQKSKQTLIIDSSQSIIHTNQNNCSFEDSQAFQRTEKIQTPKKTKTFKQPNNSHRRSFSTQKYSTKIQQNFTSTDDLNFWDLILVQQKLNKKYVQISYQKQKIFFSIDSDQSLSQCDRQNKISELNQWQNVAKRQILMTKREINNGLENLKKLIIPSKDQLNFKMKCFSEKNLGNINFCQNKSIYKKIESQVMQTNKVSISEKSNIQNKDDKSQETKKKGEVQIQLNLDKYLRQKDQTLQIIQPPIYEKQKENVDQGDNQVVRIQLFRTNNKKNLHQKSPTSPASLQSSYEQNQQSRNLFEVELESDKKEFIDLLKIQKYKLGNFDDKQENVQSSIISNKELQKQGRQKQKTILDFNPTEQDKADICQFILLDLCIQLYQETLDLEDTQIKKGKYQNTGPNRIITDIFNFIKKEKKKPKKKGPKIGIHTQLTTVKQYVEKIKKYIQNLQQKSNIQSKSSDTNTTPIINRVNNPIGPTAYEILKTMRFEEHETFQYGQQEATIQASQGLNSLILPVYVFTDFEDKLQTDKQFLFDKYFDDPQKEKNRLSFLKNVTHVHHKAIFDALNQMLDFQRPFGIWGKPFPWKKKIDKQIVLNKNQLKECLDKSCSKVVECAMYMCGLLIDKQQSLLKNTTVSESYIQQVKQDRMSKMIINDFLQNQSRFYFFDDQETQLLLQTSYVIWVLLVQEAIKEFKTIFQR